MTASGFMRQALDAGLGVRGSTSPNPWVGAALVRDGTVVATGATEPPGGAHAEAAALQGVDGHGAELYVTLEPCSPFPGKRTRPCVEAVIEAGVRRVVIALEDPDPRVRGRGIAALREAGVEVVVGDGRDEATALLRPYLKHRETGLPYVIVKFAASLDGRTATRTGESKWITGEAAREMGHQQRAWVDAVLVGSGTILADDAELTARPGGVAAARQPARVIVDARGRVAPGARVFGTGGGVIVATTGASPRAWRTAIGATGAQVLDCEGAQPGVNLDQLLQTLGQSGIMSIWAEGGATLLGALFAGGHVDEVWAFLAPLIIGGTGAQAAVGGSGAARLADAWRLTDVVMEQLGEDVLVRGYVGR